MNKNEISKVYSNSIAEEVGIEVGDKLLSINEEKVKDIIDYKFLITDEYIVIEVEKSNNEIWEIEIEKDYDEELGIEFKEYILDKPKSCHNKCVFCFIDQMPEGMRETLYFKDDDSRLSFLQGNFVTLTNMKEEDIQRIIKYRISPINVSVHTTNPELRKKMLNNRFAGNVYDIMKKLAENDIEMNCQVVSCPGINNGEELIKTIKDLYKLYPNVCNLAVVPVGVTKFREGLFNLTIYNKETALKEIKNISKLQEKFIKEIGTPFVRLSDEFYITAGVEVPSSDFYGNYDQIEDGIGMIRLLKDNIKKNLKDLNKNIKCNVIFITGVLAFEEIKDIANEIMSYNNNININVKKIINNFFGKTITVTGLLTGKDIMEQLSKDEVSDLIIMPDNIIRKGYEIAKDDKKILLDDTTIEELQNHYNVPIELCDYTGEDLIEIINEHGKEVK